MPGVPDADTRSSPDPSPPVVVGPTTLDRVLLWCGSPALGALLAYGLLRLAGWMTGLPWAPFQGPARLVDELLGERGALGVAICVVVGIVAGALFAAHALGEIAVVTVDRERLGITLGGARTDHERTHVTDVFVDRKDLVVLGVPSGPEASERAPGTDRPHAVDHVSAAGSREDLVAELVHVRTELATDRLADAFRATGWPWRDADPHVARFRRWVPGDPALPPSADAVLRARAAVLEAGKGADAADLRRELSRLDVVVRDVDKTQHWRPATPPSEHPGLPR
jgi:hypothetical protein